MPVFWRRLHDDVILVERIVDCGNLALAEGIVKRVVDLVDRKSESRRRRPIDAIVAVTRNRSSGNSPFDADELSQRLNRHARALRWAAPAYLLNVTDFGAGLSGPDETIGFTWSDARVKAEVVNASLKNLARNLADAGLVRLAHTHGILTRQQILRQIRHEPC